MNEATDSRSSTNPQTDKYKEYHTQATFIKIRKPSEGEFSKAVREKLHINYEKKNQKYT